MLNRMPKTFPLPPIFGLAPGYSVAIVVGCLSVGVIAAVTLDDMSRTNISPSADLGPLTTESFALPQSAIARQTSADASLPWVKNAAPFSAAATAPRLAIVVVDDGSDANAALSAMRLPAPITLAIAPTADSADKRADAARRYQREVLLLLPMQAEKTFDTTPNPIAINVPRDELLRRIRWNLAQIDGYVGVMNQFGEATTRDAQTMRTVMEVVQSNGLSFVDSRSHEDSIASAVARRMGVPAGDRIVAVEPGSDAADLGAGLTVGLRHAERWGTAIITIPAERKLISALEKWMTEHDSTVKLAPVTAVLKQSRSGKT